MNWTREPLVHFLVLGEPKSKFYNTKCEIPKTKQIRMTEISMTKTRGINFGCLEFRSFEL